MAAGEDTTVPDSPPGPDGKTADFRPSAPLNDEEKADQEAEADARTADAKDGGNTGGTVPTIGRIVLFRNPGLRIAANGADEVPAIITRVWGETGQVNLTAFLDNAPPQPFTSIQFKDLDKGQTPYDSGDRAWRWPPRD